MGVREKMLDEFGPEVLKKPVSKNEFYASIDAMTEAYKAVKDRLDELEAAPIRYCGVWQKSEDYKRGSVVTDGGSAWHAVKDTKSADRPGASDSWQLMVKGVR